MRSPDVCRSVGFFGKKRDTAQVLVLRRLLLVEAGVDGLASQREALVKRLAPRALGALAVPQLVDDDLAHLALTCGAHLRVDLGKSI